MTALRYASGCGCSTAVAADWETTWKKSAGVRTLRDDPLAAAADAALVWSRTRPFPGGCAHCSVPLSLSLPPDCVVRRKRALLSVALHNHTYIHHARRTLAPLAEPGAGVGGGHGAQ